MRHLLLIFILSISLIFASCEMLSNSDGSSGDGSDTIDGTDTADGTGTIEGSTTDSDSKASIKFSFELASGSNFKATTFVDQPEEHLWVMDYIDILSCYDSSDNTCYSCSTGFYLAQEDDSNLVEETYRITNWASAYEYDFANPVTIEADIDLTQLTNNCIGGFSVSSLIEQMRIPYDNESGYLDFQLVMTDLITDIADFVDDDVEDTLERGDFLFDDPDFDNEEIFLFMDEATQELTNVRPEDYSIYEAGAADATRGIYVPREWPAHSDGIAHNMVYLIPNNPTVEAPDAAVEFFVEPDPSETLDAQAEANEEELVEITDVLEEGVTYNVVVDFDNSNSLNFVDQNENQLWDLDEEIFPALPRLSFEITEE
ncbi:MAG: hypothetical protein ABIA04_00080 [Pseudomonadota bacterium]